jgi:hypothetical protein
VTDWRAIAKARGLSLAAKDLDKIAQPLEALEEVFEPLLRDLSPDLEPAFGFAVEADAE